MFRSRVAKFLLATFLAAVPVLGFALPASASTQTVGFRVGPWHCPKGLYGISNVDVFGTSSAPYASGSWSGPSNTQTVKVAISGVPANGGDVNVVVTYHCKVSYGPFTLAGPGEPAPGAVWVYGYGWQPTYTL